MKQKKRRSGISIMASLIGLVRPLLPVMCLAIFLGVIGYLCAIFLTITAGYGILAGLGGAYEKAGRLFALLIAAAVLRGLLHYGEQYCNHFIAFRLLAIIRHKVFARLRLLCPARLEGRDKGDLVSIITSDIELLEVFYAHTISPIAIAVVISAIMVIFIGSASAAAGILALAAYIVVGAVIPLIIGGRGGEDGLEYRNAFAGLNSFVLESLHGIDETIRFGCGKKRLSDITERSVSLGGKQKKLSRLEGTQKAVTELAVLAFSFGMLFLMLHLYSQGSVTFGQVLISVIAMMGSFGPVIALAGLANNLNQTLAAGERVLSLLEEEPVTEEVKNGKTCAFEGAALENVTFAYPQSAAGDAPSAERILDGVSLDIRKGRITGIHGQSGAGKSTVLKLLMRFWDADSGRVCVSGIDIRDLDTEGLRNMQSYVEQETFLFHDTLEANIGIGRPGASREDIEAAAKEASLAGFVDSLPDGLDTMIGELGDTVSGGERQRIGLARAFLHDSEMMLLDEPTSNLDSLNEGIILKSLKEAEKDRTIVIVSHRLSTLGIADDVIEMETGRTS